MVKREYRRLEIKAPFSDIIKIKSEDVQSMASERLMSIKLTTWWLRYEFMIRGDDVVIFYSLGFKDLRHGAATRVNADQGIRVKSPNTGR